VILNCKIKKKLISDFYDLVPILNDYNKNHIKIVRAKSIELAKIRNLNIDLVEVIAIFHDIGRMKENLNSFNHCESGANFLLSYYSTIPFDNFNVMITAIREHSKKGEISSAYSEVLKDADNYAHFIESTFLKPKEKIRLKYMNYPPIKLVLIDNELLLENIISYNNHLLELLENVNVHETRTTIRTLRSFIRLLDNTINYQYFEKFDKLLKKNFKSYEYSRKLSVFKKELYNSLSIKILNKTIKKANSKIRNKIIKFQPKLENMISNFPQKIYININTVLKKQLSEYILTVNKVNQNDTTSLHRLRIKGKRIKFLMENNLVAYDSRNLKVIQQLGKSIGDLNDIDENLQLLKNKKFKITSSEKKKIKIKLNKSKIEIIKKIKKEVFIMRLLVSRQIY
jgi:putative nucleotidyltransferase with HDIG domain